MLFAARLMSVRAVPFSRNVSGAPGVPPQATRPIRAAIDALEHRRMLATYNATNGNDIINIRYDMQSTTVQINSVLFGTSSPTDVIVNALDGNDVINIYGMAPDRLVSVNGGNGDDHVDVGGGLYSVNIVGSLNYNGGGGDDSIVYDDTDNTENDTYLFFNVNTFDMNTPAAPTITSNVEHKTVEAGRAHDALQILSGSGDIHLHGNAGNDMVIVTDMTDGSVTVDTGSEVTAGGDSINVNSDSTGAGDEPITVTVNQDDTIGGLTVLKNGTLRLANDAVLKKASGTLNVVGTIDVGGGALLGVMPITQITTFLNTGYNNGTWNGTSDTGAINSSLAASTPIGDGVGYGLSSQIAISTIGGFNIAPGDLLLRYTLDGDTDLDHDVDFNDLLRVGQNYNPTSGGKVWTQGNFNYNAADNVTGAVGFADLLRLSQNYNRSLAMTTVVGAVRFGSRLIEEVL
ncbi:MAG TPA: hypothetical protein PK402_00410 [Tepidisphaeraceae bacterium]|nr:hypothetical protein [Tepidisphaeraceae bacterium]